ncbi:MAG TPA: glycosyltransferase [Candidatus Dormibacteraeota bacterium]
MPAELTQVELEPAPLDRYRDLLDRQDWEATTGALRALGAATSGHVIWNLNSTPRGGGVAELLGALLPYELGAGIDARWVAIEGSPDFFAFTKRLHRLLHGDDPDGTQVDDEEKRAYESTLAENAEALRKRMRPGDVVVAHDPQVAGLVPALKEHGCTVIWRCHIGADQPSPAARQAWDLLRPYLAPADAIVFSRRAYVWEGLDNARVEVIPPCIDAFSPKNRDLDQATVDDALRKTGVAPDGLPVVLQVSRWDRLKDPVGVLEGFAEHVAPGAEGRLVLAGPEIKAVADDPEEPEVWRRLEARWRQLPEEVRGRICLAQLPMDDEDENATLVNALQRRAQVVVQKSLAEGFGLTVAEAMWKARPVVASRVGGIGDQVEDGVGGILVDDPHDLRAFGEAVLRLLRDRQLAERLGIGARQRIRSEFLASRHLRQQAALIVDLIR